MPIYRHNYVYLALRIGLRVEEGAGLLLSTLFCLELVVWQGRLRRDYGGLNLLLSTLFWFDLTNTQKVVRMRLNTKEISRFHAVFQLFIILLIDYLF